MHANTNHADLWQQLAAEGVASLPGAEPGTAVRIVLESCPKGGCAHLDQMAYSPTLGWYRQRRFTVPRDMLGEMARLLRMGDCLMPPAQRSPSAPCDEASLSSDSTDAPLPFPGPGQINASERRRQRSG